MNPIIKNWNCNKTYTYRSSNQSYSFEPCFQFRSVGLRLFEEKPSEAVMNMILNFCAEKEKEIEGMEEL